MVECGTVVRRILRIDVAAVVVAGTASGRMDLVVVGIRNRTVVAVAVAVAAAAFLSTRGMGSFSVVQGQEGLRPFLPCF